MPNLRRRCPGSIHRSLSDRRSWAEIAHHGLVDPHVAVGKEQDALLASRFPQLPDDLKCRVRLSRVGGHDEQDAVLSLGDRLDSRVDGIDLVVTRGLADAVVVIVLEDELFGFQVEALPGDVDKSGKARGRDLAKWESSSPMAALALQSSVPSVSLLMEKLLMASRHLKWSRAEETAHYVGKSLIIAALLALFFRSEINTVTAVLAFVVGLGFLALPDHLNIRDDELKTTTRWRRRP